MEKTLDIQVTEAETPVTICCSHSSIYGLKYLSRISLSILVLGFSFINILMNPGADNSISYSLISSILSFWLAHYDSK